MTAASTSVRRRPHGAERWFYRTPVALYRGPLAALLARRMCVLTTYGRRSGRPRETALNYASEGDTVYLLSGWGQRADWYRNLVLEPQVVLRIGRRAQRAIARVVIDPVERRRGLALIRESAARQGPPRWLRPLAARLGIDYDRELRDFERTARACEVIAVAPGAASS